METLKNKIFTEKSAKRHLIMLGLAGFYIIWLYISFSLLMGNWAWFAEEDATQIADPNQIWLLSVLIGFVIIEAAIAAVIIYWCAKKWMLDLLKNSLDYFISAFCWGEAIRSLHRSDDDYDEKVYCADGGSYTVRGGLPLIFAIPLGIIRSMVVGLGMCLLCLLGSIGVPILSPVLFIPGAIAYQALYDWNTLAFSLVGYLGAAVVILILVVHPILTFRRK